MIPVADVTVDDHPLSSEERYALWQALNLQRTLGVGNLDVVAASLATLLSRRFSTNSRKIDRIKSLLRELQAVLWGGDDDKTWDIYDPNNTTLRALRTYNLEARLLRDTDEIERSRDAIQHQSLTRDQRTRGS